MHKSQEKETSLTESSLPSEIDADLGLQTPRLMCRMRSRFLVKMCPQSAHSRSLHSRDNVDMDSLEMGLVSPEREIILSSLFKSQCIVTTYLDSTTLNFPRERRALVMKLIPEIEEDAISHTFEGDERGNL